MNVFFKKIDTTILLQNLEQLDCKTGRNINLNTTLVPNTSIRFLNTYNLFLKLYQSR